MSREDRYGIAGALFCFAAGWIDDWWRPLWLLCGAGLTLWTVVSLVQAWRRKRDDADSEND